MGKNDNVQTAKTAVVNTVTNIISLIVGVIMIPIISKVIPAEDIGIASVYLSTRNCMAIIISFAVYEYVFKAMLEYANEKKNYICTIGIFSIASTLIAVLICYPFKFLFEKYLSFDDFLFVWIFIGIISYVLFTIAHKYCVYHNKYIILSLMVLGTGPFGQVLAVALAVLMNSKKYIGRVIGLDIAYVIGTVFFIIWISTTNHKRPRVKYLKKTLMFSLPIIPHLLSQMVLTQSDLMMIGYFVSNEKSGIYSMAHTVSNLGYTVMIQILLSWSPWVYRRLEEKDCESIKKNSKMVILVGTYLMLGLLTISTELIKIFLADAYLPCIYIVPVLVVSVFLQFLYLFMYDIEYYNKKAKMIAIPSIAAAVSNIFLNIIFIPRFGYMAACFTTLASYAILFVLSFGFAYTLGIKKIYDIRLIFSVLIVIILYTVFMLFIIDYIWIRYVTFAIITFAFLIKEKNQIISLIKMFISNR